MWEMIKVSLELFVFLSFFGYRFFGKGK